MWRAGYMQFIPFIVTVLGVYFIDLLWGVGLGLAVAIVHILWKNYSVPFHFDPNKYRSGMPIHIQLQTLSFPFRVLRLILLIQNSD